MIYINACENNKTLTEDLSPKKNFYSLLFSTLIEILALAYVVIFFVSSCRSLSLSFLLVILTRYIFLDAPTLWLVKYISIS